MVEGQHLMRNETIPAGAVNPCPASIPGAHRPTAGDLQHLREHITALTPGGCAPLPPLSALPLQLSPDSTHQEPDRSALLKQSTPSHILKSWWKLLETPARKVAAAEGVFRKANFCQGKWASPRTLFDQQRKGRREQGWCRAIIPSQSPPGDPLSLHQLQRELTSFGLNSLKNHTVQTQLRLWQK